MSCEAQHYIKQAIYVRESLGPQKLMKPHETINGPHNAVYGPQVVNAWINDTKRPQKQN